MPFLKRIHGYHCAGDDNSHKFSTIFNAGRLWGMSSRDVSPAKRALYVKEDADTAKTLRRLFARARCFARTVDLPELAKHDRLSLEAAVLALVPAENKTTVPGSLYPTATSSLMMTVSAEGAA